MATYRQFTYNNQKNAIRNTDLNYYMSSKFIIDNSVSISDVNVPCAVNVTGCSAKAALNVQIRHKTQLHVALSDYSMETRHLNCSRSSLNCSQQWLARTSQQFSTKMDTYNTNTSNQCKQLSAFLTANKYSR